MDEGGKLNLNYVSTNVLQYLPNMTMDFAEAIMDWRGTNGIVSLDYASLGYAAKNAPFETVDELRLVYGATGVCWPATTSTATACSTRTKRT